MFVARPRRSVLYMPGSNARALEKGRSLPADGLILDMEDSVSPDAKQLAREQIIAALAQGGYGHRELMVRINALTTEWGADDIRAISEADTPPDAVLIPKPSTAADSAPVRTSSELGLSPNTRLRAPIMIDFPAPVSPVRTVNPPAKSRDKSSMMARLRTVRRKSMVRGLEREMD